MVSRQERCCSGTVLTSCGGGQGKDTCLGATSGVWQACRPQPVPQRLTLQEIGDSDAGFPAGGRLPHDHC